MQRLRINWKKKLVDMDVKHEEPDTTNMSQTPETNTDSRLDGDGDEMLDDVEKNVGANPIDQVFEYISDHLASLKDELNNTKNNLARTQRTVNTSFILAVLCTVVLVLLCLLAGYFMVRYRHHIFPQLRKRNMDHIHIESGNVSTFGVDPEEKKHNHFSESKSESNVHWRNPFNDNTEHAQSHRPLSDISEHTENSSSSASQRLEKLEQHLQHCRNLDTTC